MGEMVVPLAPPYMHLMYILGQVFSTMAGLLFKVFSIAPRHASVTSLCAGADASQRPPGADQDWAPYRTMRKCGWVYRLTEGLPPPTAAINLALKMFATMA